MTRRFNVAVVGATGAVGRTMLRVLEERNFPTARVRALASARSAGHTVTFRGEPIVVETLTAESFAGIDIALFSAGGSVSAEFAPHAARAGAVVVDNTSHFRMEPDIPLVVPEVNPHAVAGYPARNIIANPNCSTIQMVVALAPLHRRYGLKRVTASTYQSVAGAGQKGVDTCLAQTRAVLAGEPMPPSTPFAHPIAFEALPHIDRFMEDGFTKEEWKMIVETRKIMDIPDLPVCATTVRVPVLCGHSETVHVELERPFALEEIRALWAGSPGLKVVDDPANNQYPLATRAAGQDLTFVGRLRRDPSTANGIVFWCVADNLRKGAATNAVQIAELLAADHLR